MICNSEHRQPHGWYQGKVIQNYNLLKIATIFTCTIYPTESKHLVSELSDPQVSSQWATGSPCARQRQSCRKRLWGQRTEMLHLLPRLQTRFFPPPDTPNSHFHLGSQLSVPISALMGQEPGPFETNGKNGQKDKTVSRMLAKDKLNVCDEWKRKVQ